MHELMRLRRFLSNKPTDKCNIVLQGRVSSYGLLLVHVMVGSFFALLMAGCSIKRANYDVPEHTMPAGFKNAASTLESVSADKVDQTELSDWWRVFASQELDELIDRGIANNPDVRIATLRVAQAKIRADQARGGKFPTLTAPLSFGRGRAPGVDSSTQTTYQASLHGVWRPDLWGEQSSMAESAEYSVWQAAFEAENVRRNVVAAVVNSYMEYISLNERLKSTLETEKVLVNMLVNLEKRVTAGDATVADLEQLRASIFSARAAIPGLEQQREDASNSIAFLVGTVPTSLKLSDTGLESLQIPAVLPNLPPTLLLRRPDIRVIEARMLAADADIDVARARILPTLDFSVQAGTNSPFLSKLFRPDYLFWNTLSSVSATIFDAGKRSGDVAQSKMQHEEMVETYFRTVNQAVREVEGALSNIRLTGQRLDSQEKATAAARRAWNISREIYTDGGIDFMSLQDTERTYHRYLDDYQRARADQFRGYVSLFQALGGGMKWANPLPGKDINSVLPVAGQGVADPTKVSQTDGINWAAVKNDSVRNELFWLVELTGLYHSQTIGAAWRDLRARYPEQMQNRLLWPRLVGVLDEGGDSKEGKEGELAWYRLSVAKFASSTDAHNFCMQLQLDQQRCRVVSSQSDETIAAPEGGVVHAAIPHISPLPPVAAVVPAASVPASATTQRQNISPAAKGAAPLAVVPSEKTRAVPAQQSTQLATAAPVMQSENLRAKPVPPTAAIQEILTADEPGIFSVRMGSYSSLLEAERSQAAWQLKPYDTYVNRILDAQGRPLYVLQSGIFLQRADARSWAKTLEQKEHIQVTVTPVGMDAEGRPIPLNSETKPNGNKITGVVVVKPVFTIQIGLYSSLAIAVKELHRWQGKGYSVYVCQLPNDKGMLRYALRTGSYAQLVEAAEQARRLGRKEKINASPVAAILDSTGQLKFIDVSPLLKGKK